MLTEQNVAVSWMNSALLDLAAGIPAQDPSTTTAGTDINTMPPTKKSPTKKRAAKRPPAKKRPTKKRQGQGEVGPTVPRGTGGGYRKDQGRGFTDQGTGGNPRRPGGRKG